MAKSISNGLPLAAVTGHKEVMDSWGPGAHSSTFTAYPLACAGGLKVFEIFKRDHILEQAAEKGAYFLNGLEDLAKRHPIIGHINGIGLYLSVEFVMDRKTKQPAGDATGWILGELVKQGVICIHSGYFYNRLAFAPPLVINKTEIDRALGVLDRVFHEAEVKFGLVKP
jgi:4-aminobutyrate aminotransferase-like enzyme